MIWNKTVLTFNSVLPNQLGLWNTLPAPLQRGKNHSHWVSWLWDYTIWWWGFSNAGALGNTKYSFIVSPVGWGYRIHRLHLCRGVRPHPNQCPGYDTKQSVGEGSSNTGALGNAEYPFIAIVPRSTQSRSGNTW